MKNLKRIALIVLSVAIMLSCFTSCEVLESIPGFENILDMLPGGDEHVHEFGEATCTAPKTCECGATEGEALGHNYVDGKCACGAEDPNYVPPHTHNFVDGVCECGETDPNYVPPHTHNFVDGVCECGETDPNYVPPHEHNFVEGKCECGEYDHEHEYEENIFYHPELIAPTCSTPGVAVFECSLCDHYYTEETPVDPEAHGFWGEREVLVEADCQTQTNGLEKVYCVNGCGNYEEVEIHYSEAHNWDVQTDVYATCTEDGAYYAVCTLCGEIDAYDIPADGHWNWFVLCGQTGECMGCGEEFTKEHNTAWNPATCTDPAFCMSCFEYVGEALGHNYVDGVCENCFEEDPNYVPPVVAPEVLTYEYLTGTWIGSENGWNGAEHTFTIVFDGQMGTVTHSELGTFGVIVEISYGMIFAYPECEYDMTMWIYENGVIYLMDGMNSFTGGDVLSMTKA